MTKYKVIVEEYGEYTRYSTGDETEMTYKPIYVQYVDDVNLKCLVKVVNNLNSLSITE